MIVFVSACGFKNVCVCGCLCKMIDYFPFIHTRCPFPGKRTHQITFDEYMNALPPIKRENVFLREMSLRLFRSMDTDNDGCVARRACALVVADICVCIFVCVCVCVFFFVCVSVYVSGCVSVGL